MAAFAFATSSSGPSNSRTSSPRNPLLKISVKVSTPAMFRLERISSFKGAVTGLSNPLGLKSVLKMITLFARSAFYVANEPKGMFCRGKRRP